MLRHVTLMVTLATITAVILAAQAVMVAAAPKTTGGGKTIRCVEGKVCQGTSGNDVIYGTPKGDNIRAMDGNDTIYAGEGDDEVGHSGGNDMIYGGPGEDTLRGGFGDDLIFDNDGTVDSSTRTVTGVIHDTDHDLLDCAYLTSRGDTGENDEGYGVERTDPDPDTVVDCSNRDDQ